MVNNLSDVILSLKPNAQPLVDFVVRDNSDGKGPFLAVWNTATLGAQPTAAQLAAADSAYTPSASQQALANALSTLKAYMGTTPVAQGQPGYALDQAVRSIVTVLKTIRQELN